MTLFQEQLIIIPFIFFLLLSIVFFHMMPTGGFVWDTLTAPPPTVSVSSGWDVLGAFSGGWAYFVWILAKVAGVVAFLFGVILVPFSLIFAWGIWAAIVFVPLVTIFLIATLTKVLPWAFEVIRYLVDLFIGIAQAIAEAIPF